MPHQFRKETDFQIEFLQSVFSRTESIKFLRPKIWEILPQEIKHIGSFKEFEKATKQ